MLRSSASLRAGRLFGRTAPAPACLLLLKSWPPSNITLYHYSKEKILGWNPMLHIVPPLSRGLSQIYKLKNP